MIESYGFSLCWTNVRLLIPHDTGYRYDMETPSDLLAHCGGNPSGILFSDYHTHMFIETQKRVMYSSGIQWKQLLLRILNEFSSKLEETDKCKLNKLVDIFVIRMEYDCALRALRNWQWYL